MTWRSIFAMLSITSPGRCEQPIMPVHDAGFSSVNSLKFLSPLDQAVTHNVSIQVLTNYNILGYCYQCPQYSLSHLRIGLGGVGLFGNKH